MRLLIAPGAVAATLACSFSGRAGSAAAGIPEFQVRRAGIPVAGGSRDFLVLFTAGTGVHRGGFFGCAGLCIFWHSFTNRTVTVR